MLGIGQVYFHCRLMATSSSRADIILFFFSFRGMVVDRVSVCDVRFLDIGIRSELHHLLEHSNQLCIDSNGRRSGIHSILVLTRTSSQPTQC